MSTFGVGVFIFVVVIAIRVGVRLVVGAGMDAVMSSTAPIVPSCPHCSSTRTVQNGGHWDCRACGAMF